jgi:hypothetical protein
LASLRDRLKEDEERLDAEQEDEVLDTLLEIIGEKREGTASAKAAIEWYRPPPPLYRSTSHEIPYRQLILSRTLSASWVRLWGGREVWCCLARA